MRTQPYQQNRLRPIIISAGILFVVIIVVAILGLNGFFHTNPYGQGLKIDNFSKYYPSMPQDTQDTIFASLYKTARVNTPEGIETPTSGAQLRPSSDSSSYNESLELHAGEFIVDIDQIQQSFKVTFSWTTKENPGFPNNLATIQCLLGDKSKFNSTSCTDDYSATNEQATYTLHPFLVNFPLNIAYYDNNAGYVNYKIGFTTGEDQDKVTFIITDYTGGNKENALRTLAEKGVDTTKYDIVYNDESASYIKPGRAPDGA